MNEKAQRLARRMILALGLKRENLQPGTQLIERKLRNRTVIPIDHNHMNAKTFIGRLFIYENLKLRETKKIKFDVKKVRQQVAYFRYGIKLKMKEQRLLQSKSTFTRGKKKRKYNKKQGGVKMSKKQIRLEKFKNKLKKLNGM